MERLLMPTVVFTRIQSWYECYLGTNNEDYGRVDPDTGYVTFDHGDDIEVTVTPDNGFHFVGWSDDMANTNPVRRFVMTENFDWDIYPVCESDETYTLEVYADPEEGGTVTVTPLKEEYHMDERVDLVATPAEGWRFAGWHSRYWSDSGRETSVDIYRDMTIEARFVEIEGD